jgi:glycosyltransferase involved in cell wall biosynthesis
MTDTDLLWIVIPAFNEGPAIGDVVAAVRASYPHVVVVDDGSTDQTGVAAHRSCATVLRHPINLGQGAALETGIRYALSQGAERIVTFDADGQHRVDDIAVLLNRQRQAGTDVVLGSRFLGAAPGIPHLRRLLLKVAVCLLRLTSGIQVSDVHNGLRLLTKRAAEQIRIRQNRMAHASEIIEQIHALGLSMCEAPVTIVYTDYSLAKGQRLSNIVNVVSELFLARLRK